MHLHANYWLYTAQILIVSLGTFTLADLITVHLSTWLGYHETIGRVEHDKAGQYYYFFFLSIYSVWHSCE